MDAHNAQHRHIDVFNGDADGIASLHQLRLAFPCESELVTGVKRDISLLDKVEACGGDQITVLDISLDANQCALKHLLDQGASIQYFDHHMADAQFPHPALDLHLSSAPDCCTAMLVNRYLGERYPMWAIVAAYGDGLLGAAHGMAMQEGIGQQGRAELEELGRLLNYNAYGEQLDDLQFHPADLYQELHRYVNPYDFIHNSTYHLALQFAYSQEQAYLEYLQPLAVGRCSEIYLLPAEHWATRLTGVLANRLRQQAADKSFAVLTPRRNGDLMVSVRSAMPLERPASYFCACFHSGGGRHGAAGINQLPPADMDAFVTRFFDYFESAATPHDIAKMSHSLQHQ